MISLRKGSFDTLPVRHGVQNNRRTTIMHKKNISALSTTATVSEELTDWGVLHKY